MTPVFSVVINCLLSSMLTTLVPTTYLCLRSGEGFPGVKDLVQKSNFYLNLMSFLKPPITYVSQFDWEVAEEGTDF